MGKIITWYQIWIKIYLRRISTWVLVAATGLLLWILSLIQLPGNDTVRVGICYPKGEYGRNLQQLIEEETSIFIFESYESKDKLYDDVLSGELECGFIFDEKFQQKIEEDKARGAITCLSTPFSFKAEVAKETLYAQLLKMNSRYILEYSEVQVFGNEDELRRRILFGKEASYQKSNQVFQMKVIEISRIDTEQKEEKQLYPIQAVGGLMVFLYIFLAQGKKFREDEGRVEAALSMREQFLFGVLRNLAAGSVPTLVFLIVLQVTGVSRGWMEETIRVVLFLLFSAIWSQFVGRYLKKETTFVAFTLAIGMVQLFVCPVFWHWNDRIAAMEYVSMLFPLGIYLLG